MGSPPKPWERAGAVPAVSDPTPSVPAASSLSSTAPAIPERPASIAGSTMSGTTAYAGSTYGAAASPYSAYSSPYGASPYSRFGGGYGAGSMYGGSMFGTGGYGMGYGSGYGGGYGGYGGMGYGGAYGGIGGYGGMGPMMGDPNAPMSLTAHLESTTQQTFQLLHSIVQTFGGFAQMLESTFMATHSSFFAMVGVADQFAQLRGVLGQVLGLFGLLRWLKALIRGETTPSMTDEFRGFLKNPPGTANATNPPGAPARRPSRKPLFVFLLAIFGIPYLMNRLIRYLSSLPRLPPGVTRGPNGTFVGPNGEVMTAGPRGELIGPDGRPVMGMNGQPWMITGPQAAAEIDPSKLEFARALWQFDAAKGNEAVELTLAKGEIVAILSKGEVLKSVDGNAGGDWWRGRTRNGREGWFPATFVEIIKKPDSLPSASPPASVAGGEPKKID